MKKLLIILTALLVSVLLLNCERDILSDKTMTMKRLNVTDGFIGSYQRYDSKDIFILRHLTQHDPTNLMTMWSDIYLRLGFTQQQMATTSYFDVMNAWLLQAPVIGMPAAYNPTPSSFAIMSAVMTSGVYRTIQSFTVLNGGDPNVISLGFDSDADLHVRIQSPTFIYALSGGSEIASQRFFPIWNNPNHWLLYYEVVVRDNLNYPGLDGLAWTKTDFLTATLRVIKLPIVPSTDVIYPLIPTDVKNADAFIPKIEKTYPNVFNNGLVSAPSEGTAIYPWIPNQSDFPGFVTWQGLSSSVPCSVSKNRKVSVVDPKDRSATRWPIIMSPDRLFFPVQIPVYKWYGSLTHAMPEWTFPTLTISGFIEILVIHHTANESPTVRFLGTYYNRYYSRYMVNYLKPTGLWRDRDVILQDMDHPIHTGTILAGWISDLPYDNPGSSESSHMFSHQTITMYPGTVVSISDSLAISVPLSDQFIGF